MKNKILVISILLILSSCLVHKGQINDGKCRPKNPKFELLKIPFKKSENLTFNKVYTLDDLEKMGIGFFEDGRIILVKNYNYSKQNYDLITPFFMKSKNSKRIWELGISHFYIDIQSFSFNVFVNEFRLDIKMPTSNLYTYQTDILGDAYQQMTLNFADDY